MLNELGRYAGLKVSETGLFNGELVSETGAKILKHRVVAGFLSAIDCVDPRQSAAAAPQDLSEPFTAGASILITTYAAAVASNTLNLMANYATAASGQPLILWPDYIFAGHASLSVISAVLLTGNLHPVSFPVMSACAAAFNFSLPSVASDSAPMILQADFVAAVQSVVFSVGGIPRNSATCAPLELSPRTVAACSVLVPLIDPAIAANGNLLEIDDKNIIISASAAPFNMGLESVIMPAPVYTVFAGDFNINDLIENVEIREDLDAAHSDFSFDSSSRQLFDLLTPPQALNITINGVERSMVLEEINMTGALSFKCWGRSASCLLDSPHHAAVTVEADGTLTAAGLALSIAGVTAWTATDYPLPEGWSMTGTPTEIVIRLAVAVGAVVQPDGSTFKVMPRFQARPVNWTATTPALFYTRETNILSLSWDDEGRTAWNSVVVTGRSEPWQPPILEVEESSPAPGDNVHVRIFRKGTSEMLFDNMVTDGRVVRIADGSLTIENEPVQFSGYRGSLKYPADDIISLEWIGDSRGDVYWLDGGRSTELELAPGSYPDLEGFGLALITYRTSYERYLLSGHNVAQLMLICTQPETESVRVRVLVNGQAAPEAPGMTEELATTEAAAVAAATAWLDNNRYNLRRVPTSAPHEAAALPGTLICLADEIENVSGPGMIERRTININGPAVTDRLEVVQCLS